MPRILRIRRRRIARPKRRAIRRRAKPTAVVNKAIAPFPQRFFTKHKYSTTFTINSLTPTYQFNINSLYDPDLTSFGHQPYGRDQMAQLYNKYRVYGVTYMITGFQANNPIRVGALPSNTVTPPLSNMASLIEQPRAKYITQHPNAPRAVLKGYVNLPSLVGRTRAQYMADDTFSAQTSANPQENMILSILAQTLNDTGIDGCSMTATFQFHCEWFDPIAFSTS